MRGDSRFRAGGWEKTMDLLASLPPSNDSLKGGVNPFSLQPHGDTEKSHAFNLCIFWVFGDCFHPQICFKLNTSSLINLSPRAAFLAWFSLVSLNQHQPLHIFPAAWQCWSLCHLPSLLLFMHSGPPQNPISCKPGDCSPLQMCGCTVRTFLPPFKPPFYGHIVSQGSSE